MSAPDLDPDLLVDLDTGDTLAGLCGHCGITVDSTDPNHRVSSIVRGGRGVECVLRGDIAPWQGGLLDRRQR